MTEPTMEQSATSVKPPATADDILQQILASVREAAVAEAQPQAVIDQLQRLDDPEAIVRKRAAIIKTARAAAIAETDPADWTLTRNDAGAELGMVGAAGTAKMAPILGIKVINVRPRKPDGTLDWQKIDQGNGVYSYRLTFDAYWNLTDTLIEGLEAERRSDEDFTGRGVSASGKITTRNSEKVGALDQDLRSSVSALCRTKAVRVLAGMARVPKAELESAWRAAGANKSSENCQRGHGYGGADGRRAQQDAPDDVKSGAAELWRDIQGAVGGNLEHAKRILKEVTSAPATKDRKAFEGFDDFQRIAQAWQLERAREKWARHPMRQQAEPGAEG